MTLNGVALGDTAVVGSHAADRDLPGARRHAPGERQPGAGQRRSASAGSIFYVDRFDTTYERTFTAQGDALAFRGDGHGLVTVSGFSGPQVRVLDVTDPRRPRWVTGLRVDRAAGGASITLLPSTPATPYVAVGPAAVRAPAVDPPRGDGRPALPRQRRRLSGGDDRGPQGAPPRDLAALRAAQGLRTAVVDVADVMDQFNYGVSSPHALHDFLAYVHASWSPAPRYVVLAGGGNFDYRNLLGLGGNLVPPLMVVTPWGLFASDNRLADGDGDGLPDVAIGRLPVVSAAELQGVVAEAPGLRGGGRRRLGRTPAGARRQPRRRRRLRRRQPRRWRQRLPSGWSAQSIDLGASGLAAARSGLFAALGAGADLVTYLGHGGLDRLAAPGLLTTSDVPALSNSPRLPLVAALTCSVNRFEVPGFSSLGEELVRQPAAAAWRRGAPPASPTTPRASALGASFLREMGKPSNPRLGDAVLAALRDEASSGVAATLDLYTFLGTRRRVSSRCRRARSCGTPSTR